MISLKTLMAASCASCVLPLLVSCAPMDAEATAGNPPTAKMAERMNDLLAGKISGEPDHCINTNTSFGAIKVSDHTLLYRSNSNLVYRNDLRGSCPGLSNSNDVMVIEKRSTQTCAGDLFHLVDRNTGIRGATCVFGEFVPYRTPGSKG